MSDLRCTTKRLACLAYQRYCLSRWLNQTSKKQLKSQGQARRAQKSNERDARKPQEKYGWIQTRKQSHDSTKCLAEWKQKVHRKTNQEHPVGTNYASSHSESEATIRRNNQEHRSKSKPETPPFHPINHNWHLTALKRGDEATRLSSSAYKRIVFKCKKEKSAKNRKAQD